MTDEQYKKWRDSLPEYTPTPEECEEIERAKEEFARGEFISFSSMEGVASGFCGFTTVRMQTQLYQGIQGVYQ